MPLRTRRARPRSQPRCRVDRRPDCCRGKTRSTIAIDLTTAARPIECRTLNSKPASCDRRCTSPAQQQFHLRFCRTRGLQTARNCRSVAPPSECPGTSRSFCDTLAACARLRRCADDRCRACDRCPGSAGRDGQNLPPGNSFDPVMTRRPAVVKNDRRVTWNRFACAALIWRNRGPAVLVEMMAQRRRGSKRKTLLQITEIRRDGLNLCFGQVMRDRPHDGGVVRLGLVLTSFFVPVRQFPEDVVMELARQTRKCVGAFGIRPVTGSAWRNLGAWEHLLRRFSFPQPPTPLALPLTAWD